MITINIWFTIIFVIRISIIGWAPGWTFGIQPPKRPKSSPCYRSWMHLGGSWGPRDGAPVAWDNVTAGPSYIRSWRPQQEEMDVNMFFFSCWLLVFHYWYFILLISISPGLFATWSCREYHYQHSLHQQVRFIVIEYIFPSELHRSMFIIDIPVVSRIFFLLHVFFTPCLN